MRSLEFAQEPCEPQATYAIGGQRWNKEMPGFAEAIAQAYEQGLRPRCLCLPVAEGGNIEMYVARLVEGYIVKRMPNTGSQHATNCSSYEPPGEFSGLGQLLGTAIVENPATGETTLRLDFPMTKLPGRSTLPPASTARSNAKTQGNGLSLRGLLHYLWHQADLTRWHPGFSGRRTWSTVRSHLLRAAAKNFAGGQRLLASLYIPEMFSVEQRAAINTRRLQHWAHSRPAPGAPQSLMLMIAELKEIVPARHGYQAVIKHVPDQSFGLDDQLYRRLGRCFERELALWRAAENLHLLAIATFGIAETGIPSIVEMSLMPATAQWLLIEDQFERQLVAKLVGDGRSFIKCLNYNVPATNVVVSASLTDFGALPQLLIIARQAITENEISAVLDRLETKESPPLWIWHALDEAMPCFPLKTDAPNNGPARAST